MAPSTAMNSSLEQLVKSLLPDQIPPPKLKKLREGFSRKLRLHNYARTNQFEVAEKFETLQEKLMILNNDELADAFRSRLSELTPLAIEWLPDILDFLLKIADNPAEKTRIEWLSDRPKSPITVPSLTWADLEADDPVDRDDPIWKVPEYSDFSSDEDGQAKTPRTPPSKTAQASQALSQLSIQGPPSCLDIRNHTLGPAELDSLSKAQFWSGSDTTTFELGEDQIMREVLFMLQGLPTTLFWRAGDHFEIDQRLRMRYISRSSLKSILDDLCEVAVVIGLVRNFLKRVQSDPLHQMFKSVLEEAIEGVDARLRGLEKGIVGDDNKSCSTLLGLTLTLKTTIRPASLLADLVKTIDKTCRDSVTMLEILFDLVCQNQIQGDRRAFECVARIFAKCFEVYWDQLQQWMDGGRLPQEGSLVFVSSTNRRNDYSVLWQKWYQVSEDSMPHRCPRFLKLLQSQIFNIGKTQIFLDQLGASSPKVDEDKVDSARFQVDCNVDSLLPFSETFKDSFQSYVESRLISATSSLRHQLGTNCGLWEVLEALEHVYFASNGAISDSIDTRMFVAIDKCDKHWSDRYLLQETFQTVYESIPCVETARISIINQATPSRNMAKRRQSVRLLGEVRVDYALPWHVANIITRPSLSTYRRISIFLAQIRRARYLLERRTLHQVWTSCSQPSSSRTEKAINLSLSHQLLTFTNSLYSHLTSTIIATSTKSLHTAFLTAIDIDAMIVAHTTFCHSLDHACLLTPPLRPIHDQILAILDLCVRFSDLNNQTPNPLDSSSDAADAQSWVSARSGNYQRHKERPVDSDSEDEEEGDDGEGFSTFIVPEESTLLEQLEKVKVGFDEKRRFVVEALRGAERSRGVERSGLAGVGVGRGWEMLADRLEWEKKRRRKGVEDEEV